MVFAITITEIVPLQPTMLTMVLATEVTTIRTVPIPIKRVTLALTIMDIVISTHTTATVTSESTATTITVVP